MSEWWCGSTFGGAFISCSGAVASIDGTRYVVSPLHCLNGFGRNLLALGQLCGHRKLLLRRKRPALCNWLLMLSTSWPSFSVLATKETHSGSARKAAQRFSRSAGSARVLSSLTPKSNSKSSPRIAWSIWWKRLTTWSSGSILRRKNVLSVAVPQRWAARYRGKTDMRRRASNLPHDGQVSFLAVARSYDALASTVVAPGCRSRAAIERPTSSSVVRLPVHSPFALMRSESTIWRDDRSSRQPPLSSGPPYPVPPSSKRSSC